jgi:ABC-type nitrate/sulfonate/bicarbonate transport system ATPase subunit
MGSHFVVEGIAKAYCVGSARRTVLPGITFSMRRGDILALLGPSGCGKSTLLNILAGFEHPDAGYVLLDGAERGSPGPDRAVVFQEDALFPWLTALENIELGLQAAGRSKAQRRDESARMLGLTGLEGFEHHLPRMLSGGMRQRLALARVLALNPQVLLMDEPFVALDAITREQMHDLLISLHQELAMTVIFVTHDVREAVKLADTVLVMGRSGLGIMRGFHVPYNRPRMEDDAAMIAMRGDIRMNLQI